MTSPYDTLEHELRVRRARTQSRRVAGRSALVLTSGCVALIVLVVSFAILPWTILPALFDLGLIATILAFAAVLLDEYVLRPPSLVAVARALDAESGLAHPMLSVAVQVGARTESSQGSLAAETVRRAVTSIGQYPRHAATPALRPRLSMAGTATVALAAVLIAFSPRITSYLLLPLRGPALDVSVAPGTVALPTGASVTLSMRLNGSQYPSCGLWLSLPGQQQRTYRILTPDSSGGFTYTIDSLASSTVYTFAPGGAELAPETLIAVAPPSLLALEVTLSPPPYTHASPRTLAEGQGDFSTPAGTSASVSLTSSFPLRAAKLCLPNDTLAMTTLGVSATTVFTVRSSLPYTFALEDTLGQRSDSLPGYFAEAVADEPPIVHIPRPGANRALSPAMRESLLVEAVDDYGIRSLRIEYLVPRADSLASIALAAPSQPPAVQAVIDWVLVPLGLYPGDTVFYWAVARDNRPGGGSLGVSDTFWMRVPGFEEIHRQLAAQSGQAQKTMESVRNQQRDLRDQVEDLARSAQGRKKLSWEQKKILEDVASKVEQQRDSLTAAMDELRQAVENMREQDEQSGEISRKMDEVRKAVEELVKQYGDSLLFEKREAPAELSMKDLANAMEQMKRMLPELGERLDQALRYLDMLRRDQQLASLAQRFDQMAERQLQTCSMGDSAQQARRQNELNAGTQQLSAETRQQMQGEQAMLEPFDVPSLDNVDQLSQELNQMANQNASQSQCQGARRQMAGSLSAAAQELRNSMSSAMAQRMEQEQRRMLGMVHDVLALGQWQAEQSDQAERGSEASDLVRAQQALREALEATRGALDSLSMVPPSLLARVSNAYTESQRAMMRAEAAAASESGGSAPAMSEAVAGLNSAAQALLEASDGMMSGKSGGAGGGGQGSMSGMKKLSGRQAAINAATGEILRQMLQGQQPGGGTQSGSNGEALGQARDQARRAQQALADQLKELADQYAQEGGPGGKERVKELEEEARRLARMLENPTPELAERQDRFLARMLQTTLSLHREEEGKEERQSKTATSVLVPDATTGPAKRFSDTDAYYRLRQQAFRGNIPAEYRAAVKAYFDSLGVLYLNAR